MLGFTQADTDMVFLAMFRDVLLGMLIWLLLPVKVYAPFILPWIVAVAPALVPLLLFPE